MLLFILFYLPARSQNFSYEGGEYMDTTTTHNPACAKSPFVPYFSVGGKYPRSSETLAAEATAFLQRRNQRYSGSGYVTFRFVVDCAGYRLPKTQVLQTNANYQATHFRKELVNELYAYLQTLKDWRTVTTSNGMLANYFTYLTFKISNGKVVAVIP
ncbi:hypothetical protein [Hymenobacter negativus]|uniref:hypothetical protein n=1 Tax=Hymenobacter negativus TaxID=2795026 RepID=UPI001AAE3658|nr:hypothetical protein [Hymenobacter negativus]